jgi:hypothetical protein
MLRAPSGTVYAHHGAHRSAREVCAGFMSGAVLTAADALAALDAHLDRLFDDSTGAAGRVGSGP